MRYGLFAIAFLTGFLLLMIEVLAQRVLAPLFGNTALVWSGVLTAFMVGMGLGYLNGGAWARAAPETVRRRLALLLLAAGAVAWLIPLAGNRLLFTLSAALVTRLALLAASFLLFAPPSFLLAATAPLLVQLLSHYSPALPEVGTVAGRFLAVSTIGSLLGALTTGFVLLPQWPLSTLFHAAATALGVAAATLFLGQVRPRHRAGGVLLLVGTTVVAASSWRNHERLPAGVLWKSQNLYQQHLVLERGSRRYLMLDNSVHGGVDLDSPGIELLPYLKATALAKLLTPTGVPQFLIIGGGTYRMARRLRASHPTAHITVVELDPQVTALARRFFDFTDDEHTAVIHGDARGFLRRYGPPFDLIWLDAFTDYRVIPSHYLTREFFSALRRRLKPGGLFLANTVARTPPADRGDALFVGIGNTLGQVFPELLTLWFPAADPTTPFTNCVWVAIAPPLRLKQEQVAMLLNKESRVMAWDATAAGPLFTDDYNPSDFLALKGR
jgi:spermidine synthase